MYTRKRPMASAMTGVTMIDTMQATNKRHVRKLVAPGSKLALVITSGAR